MEPDLSGLGRVENGKSVLAFFEDAALRFGHVLKHLEAVTGAEKVMVGLLVPIGRSK